MSFVIVGGERFALEIGDTVLGGRGANALDAASLAELPPFAVVTYPVEGPATVRAVGSLPVTLDGATLTSAPVTLRHGQRLEAAGRVIAFGEMRNAGRTSMAPGAGDHAVSAELARAGMSTPTATTGGHLLRLSDRSSAAIPEAGLTIGREPSCGVVVASKEVSRTHAEIVPSLLGYRLTDLSANGVWVNGSRVEGSCVLGQHDVIRVGTEEFRFEADAASFEPELPVEAVPAATPSAVPPERHRPVPLFASLEVVSAGPLEGTRYRVERPTVQIGRSTTNDICIGNESVSGNHATLVQAGATWTILDLGSRNGTYVDGEIVRAQRALPPTCELQLGMVKLVFRAINVPRDDSVGTVGVFGIRDG